MMKATKIGIWAVANNGAMGLDNNLPWRKVSIDKKVFKEDLKKFQEITTGHVVIMGRKTALSLGKPLADRINIIITRDKEKFLSNPQWDPITDAKKVYCYNNLKEAIEDFEDKHEKIFIAGGAEIYKLAFELGLIDEVIASEGYDDFPGDTFLPSNFKKEEWNRQILEDFPQDGYRYKRVRYY